MIIINKLTTLLAELRPEIVFLIIASACGLVFTPLTPPFQVSDENAHFLRAYQIAGGTIRPSKFPDGQYGGLVPPSMLPVYGKDEVTNLFEPSNKESLEELRYLSSIRINRSKLVPVVFTNTAIYSPLPYVPQVIGIDIARSLPGKTPYLLAFYLARLCNLTAAVTLIYWAIKKIPLLKWGVVLVFLTPMAVYQFASVSSDAVTFGLATLAVGFGLAGIVATETAKNKDLFMLAALCVLTALLRVPYALLAIIPFIALARGLGGKFNLPKTVLLSALVAMVSAGLFLGWQLWFNSLNINFYPAQQTTISATRQLHSFSNVPRMLSVLVQTHFSNTFNTVITSMVGAFGWGNLQFYVPQWLVSGYFFFLIATAFILTPGEKKITKRWLRWLCSSVFLVSCLGIDIAEYLYWSSVGSPFIENIQGRYYLPLIILVMVAVQGRIVLSKADWRKFHLSRLGFIGLTQIVGMLIVLNRYWIK